MNYDEIIKRLSVVLKPKRLEHSIGVSNTAVELAELYGGDVDKARIAGILHDCARNMPKNNLLQMLEVFAIVVDDAELCEPALLHARVGAHLARKVYGVEDEEICRAIAVHTVGASHMTLLDKIIYLADFIEPGRDFPGVEEIRRIAKLDLNQAMLASFDHTIQYIIDRKGFIHPDTIAARNGLLRQCNAKTLRT